MTSVSAGKRPMGRVLSPLVRRLGSILAAALVLTGTVGVAAVVHTTSAGAVSPLTPGDLLVYRVGTGSGSLGSGAAAVTLNEYSPTGALVESLPLPTASSGSVNALTASGSATSEGQLTLSADGSSVVAAGYDAPPGTNSVSGTTSASVPRTVAVVGPSGSVDTSTALTDALSGNNVRGAATTDGVHLWVSGSDPSSGVRATTIGSTTSTPLVSSTYKNFRSVDTADGQLYVSADPTKASVTVAKVGSGLPTTGTNTVTNLPFATSPSSPYAFAFLTLGSGSAPDTLYVADNGAAPSSNTRLKAGNGWRLGSVAVPVVSGVIANDSQRRRSRFTPPPATKASTAALLDQDVKRFKRHPFGRRPRISPAPLNEGYRGLAFVPGTVDRHGWNAPARGAAVIKTEGSARPPRSATRPTPPTRLTIGDSELRGERTDGHSSTPPTRTVAPQANITSPASGKERLLHVTPDGGRRIEAHGHRRSAQRCHQSRARCATAPPTSCNASDRYYDGAGNASTVDRRGRRLHVRRRRQNNILRLYHERHSGEPVKTYNFTSVLPYGQPEMDIEASARAGNMLYWMGSQSQQPSW